MPISLDELKKKGEIKKISTPQTLTAKEIKPSFSATPLGTSGLASTISGFAKGGFSTLKGMSTLGEKALQLPLKALGVKFPEQSSAEQLQSIVEQKKNIQPGTLLEGANTTEQVSKTIEQIAEFLLPTGVSTKVSGAVKASPLLAKAPNFIRKSAPLVSKMVTEAGLVGGQTALQQGEIDNAAKTNAIIAAAFPLIGSGLTKLTEGVGTKILDSVIKPSIADIKNGFKMSTVKEFNLGGSLRSMLSKTSNTLNKLSSELTDALKGTNHKVNLGKVYSETADTLLKNKSKTFGNNKAIQRVLAKLTEEIDEVSPNLKVDLLTANNVKRGAGTKGAWVYGSPDPDASAIEAVYNTFYNKLKTEIEKTGTPAIRKINQQLSKLIPVQSAILRRIPVAERNNLLSLSDSIGLFAAVFDPKALALIGAKKLSMSGAFGNVLVKAAEIMKNSPETVRRLPMTIASQITK